MEENSTGSPLVLDLNLTDDSKLVSIEVNAIRSYGLGCVIGVLSLVSITLNTLTIHIFCRRQKWVTTVMRYHILSLALSDLLQVPFLLLPTTVYTFTGRWVMGSFMCKLYCMFRVAFFNISLCTHGVIAVQRCRSVKGSHDKSSEKKSIAVIVLVWLYNLLCSIPLGVWADVLPVHKTCSVQRDKNSVMIYYNSTTRAINGFVPIMTILISYGIIICRLKKVHPATENEIMEKSRFAKTVTRVCILLVTIYIICSLPFQISVILVINQTVNTPLLITIQLTFCLAVVGSTLNPIIYRITWKGYKRKCGQVLKKLCRCKTNSTTVETETTYN